MKISVGCHSRAAAREPSCLCLGQSCLPVSRVLQHQDQPDACLYEVRVLDGRRFVVRRQVDLDQWELVAVYDRAQKRRSRAPVWPAAAALLLLALAIVRKAPNLARRTVKWLTHGHDLPKGGAPA